MHSPQRQEDESDQLQDHVVAAGEQGHHRPHQGNTAQRYTEVYFKCFEGECGRTYGKEGKLGHTVRMMKWKCADEEDVPLANLSHSEALWRHPKVRRPELLKPKELRQGQRVPRYKQIQRAWTDLAVHRYQCHRELYHATIDDIVTRTKIKRRAIEASAERGVQVAGPATMPIAQQAPLRFLPGTQTLAHGHPDDGTRSNSNWFAVEEAVPSTVMLPSAHNRQPVKHEATHEAEAAEFVGCRIITPDRSNKGGQLLAQGRPNDVERSNKRRPPSELAGPSTVRRPSANNLQNVKHEVGSEAAQKAEGEEVVGLGIITPPNPASRSQKFKRARAGNGITRKTPARPRSSSTTRSNGGNTHPIPVIHDGNVTPYSDAASSDDDGIPWFTTDDEAERRPQQPLHQQALSMEQQQATHAATLPGMRQQQESMPSASTFQNTNTGATAAGDPSVTCMAPNCDNGVDSGAADSNQHADHGSNDFNGNEDPHASSPEIDGSLDNEGLVSDTNDDSADDMVVSDDEGNTDHDAGNSFQQVGGPDIPVKAALQAAASRCGPIEFSPENVKLLDDLQNRKVFFMGKQTTLAQLCHAPVLSKPEITPEANLMSFLAETGLSKLYLASAQSNKTMVSAAIAAACCVVNLPLIIIVGESVSNVRCNAIEKMGGILKQLSWETKNGTKIQPHVEYRNGAADLWKGHRSFTRLFKQGQAHLMVPATPKAMRRVEEFLRMFGVRNAVVVLDEADKLMTSYVASKDRCTTERDKYLAKILSTYCKRVVWVSATHLSTLMFHTAVDLPFHALSVARESLPGRGYATEDNLKPVPAWLDPREMTLKNRYGIKSKPVQREMRHFKHTARYHSEKEGLLMLLAMSLRVRPGAKPCPMYQYKLARVILRKLVPDAVCIVVNGTTPAVNMLYNDPQHPEYARGEGKLFEVTDESNRVGEAIRHVDSKWGLKKPVIVIGYHCVGRAVSIRSDKRVLTHAIVYTSPGANAADTNQLGLRPNGYVLKALRDNRHRHVRLLCSAMDYFVIKDLYDFTKELLEKAGDGTQQGLARWQAEVDNNPRYQHLLNCDRRLVNPGLLAGQHNPFIKEEVNME